MAALLTRLLKYFKINSLASSSLNILICSSVSQCICTLIPAWCRAVATTRQFGGYLQPWARLFKTAISANRRLHCLNDDLNLICSWIVLLRSRLALIKTLIGGLDLVHLRRRINSLIYPLCCFIFLALDKRYRYNHTMFAYSEQELQTR